MLVVCEGETELQYLLELAAFMSIGEKVNIRRTEQQDPGVEIERLAKEQHWARICGADRYAEIWLVFDRDSHARYRKAVRAAAALPEFRTAFSRPCIEYWFLLHFQEFSGSLPKNGKTLLSREVLTEIDADGMEVETTIEKCERITTPDVCLDKLLQFASYYSKTKISFLQYFGSRTKIAYERAKSLSGSPFGHGSDIPALFDRFCEIAGSSPEAVLDALATGVPLPGGTVCAIPCTDTCDRPPDQLAVARMAEILAKDEWTISEEDWLQVGHSMESLAAWTRRAILRRSAPAQQKTLATSCKLHLLPEKGVTEDEMKRAAKRLMMIIAGVHGKVEELDVTGLKNLFASLQHLDRGVRSRVPVENEETG